MLFVFCLCNKLSVVLKIVWTLKHRKKLGKHGSMLHVWSVSTFLDSCCRQSVWVCLKAGDWWIETRCQPKNFRQESQTLNNVWGLYTCQKTPANDHTFSTQGIFEDDNFPCPRVVNVGCSEGSYIICTFSLSEYVHNLGHGEGERPWFWGKRRVFLPAWQWPA